MFGLFSLCVNVFFNSCTLYFEFSFVIVPKSIAKDVHDIFDEYLIVRAQIFLEGAKFVMVVLLSSVKL